MNPFFNIVNDANSILFIHYLWTDKVNVWMSSQRRPYWILNTYRKHFTDSSWSRTSSNPLPILTTLISNPLPWCGNRREHLSARDVRRDRWRDIPRRTRTPIPVGMSKWEKPPLDRSGALICLSDGQYSHQGRARSIACFLVSNRLRLCL